MLVGASAVILSVKSALDHIFGGHDHDSKRDLWISILVARFKAFLMVLILDLLVAMLYIFYRFSPDRPPAPLPALIGALVAAVLLWLGRGIIGWYVATVGTAWAFGAAGALAVVLVWIFVSACTALLGAECAKCLDRQWAGS